MKKKDSSGNTEVQRYMQLATEFVKGGWEFVGHGWSKCVNSVAGLPQITPAQFLKDGQCSFSFDSQR